ncbi:TetR family transcriptional regulator [Bacillus cereus]|uniref:TetR/AcrR family transcriptional regulator n=1 Tax=Bacillus sp. AFS023182 TaxID=2033492 RepID=UPI000BF4E1A3|nr:TetR/AcrR family transcriptional regulator [Bacillus sp. AFS023182]PFE01010.1 TetR family transcriptional regulator [Bacillus sp. AFS023182]PGX91129.1 TetR family transcriptional regulator [Bacillus cereus]
MRNTTTLNGFERVKKKKKEAIKKAAFSLFTEKGYKDVKIEDIAKQAQVSQVTIYNHFGSKDALFRELIMDFTIEEVSFYEELIKSQLCFKEKMHQMLTRKLQQSSIFHPEMIEQAMHSDQKLREFLISYQNKTIIPIFLSFVRRAQEDGEINPDLSQEMILLYINMFNQLGEQQAPFLLDMNHEQHTKELLTMFYYGLSNPNK